MFENHLRPTHRETHAPAMWLLFLGVALCPVVKLTAAEATKFPPDQIEFFEKKIRPLLSNRCYKCHSAGAEKIKGELLLDSREAAIKGGEKGPAVVPGNLEKSLLIEAIRYENQDMQMPPKSKLSDAEIADLTTWVGQGAPWPDEAPPARTAGPVKKVFDLEDRKRKHWCWEPLNKATPPTPKNVEWSSSTIDRFVLAKLEEKNLRPAPAADAATLLRRLCFDITGLPAKPEEVEAFVSSYAKDPKATLESKVDSLLASPAFGERWSRHWLDLVRYAESRGHEFDPLIPNAYQYRDYLIRALNTDVPYNQFVAEHLAGDLLPRPRRNPETGANESILGTGFWFLGEEVHSPVDIRQDEADRMDNRLDVMSKTFLGMTVACARCHDHKFDAISQRDYYALTGFLISSTYRQARFETMEDHREIATQLDGLRTRERSRILQTVSKSLAPALQKTAAYLLGARELLMSKEDQVKMLEQISKQRSIDATQLSLWAAELKEAQAAATHPLHAFAKVALEPGSDDAAEFSKRLSPILAEWQKQKQTPDAAIPPQNVVVDYAHPEPKDWVQDGVTFGQRPVKMGDPVFGTDPNQPLNGIMSRDCARHDSVWDSLTTRSSEHDYGSVGAWERGGNVLRTPDATLSTGKLWYLVRGSGRAYAVVNSHLIIGGPLHGALLKDWHGENGRWQWVEHNLSNYKGHRVNVQFSPSPQRDDKKQKPRDKGKPPVPASADSLCIAMVVQSETRPPLPELPNDMLVSSLGDATVNSPAVLAEKLQQVFLQSAKLMFEDKLSTSASASALADWILQHTDLFESEQDAGRQQMQAALEPFTKEQSALIARIKYESHTAPAMLDGSGVDEFVLTRGQTKQPGEAAPRRFLEAIAGTQPPKIATGSGRLELARQIVDPANPFASRVIVNRIWHHLFGRGIVPTVDNFGVLGQPPSHRDLLDYLAAHFMNDQGWSVKKLIREIVLSRTYQMSSAPADAAAEQADPENLLLHRMNLKRLEGEAIRDSVLAISGRLNPETGGPSVPAHLTTFMEGRGRPGGGPLDGNGRRSIYIAVRRNFIPPMMLAFDTPIPFTAMGRRNVSNVPAQALIMMNDPFIVEQARIWAKKLATISDMNERVRQMHLAAFGRPPEPAELQEALAFVESQSKTYGAAPNDERVWADLGHVLFNVKTFIYLN